MSDPISLVAESPQILRLSKYSGVSVVSTVLGLGFLYLFNAVLGIYAPVANVLAILVGAPPVYLLHRRWVWAEASPTSEVVAFGQFSVSLLLSVAVSTSVIAVADWLWGDGLIAVAAAIGSHAVVWLVRFVFFDRLVFAQ